MKMQILILTLLIIIYIFILDMVWLGVIAKNIYAQEIGSLFRKYGDQISPNWLAASLVYLAIALAIIYFVMPKAEGNVIQAIFCGALFGALVYGIYDFTNMSVLAHWTWKISIIDVAWGTVLCSSASGFAMVLQSWLSR
jgi:uncharacterized membrane protein